MTKFEETDLNIIDCDGKEWFTTTDIGRALGYANPRTDIVNLFKRNAQEIEAHETCVCKLQAQGDTQARDYRLFTKAAAKYWLSLPERPRRRCFGGGWWNCQNVGHAWLNWDQICQDYWPQTPQDCKRNRG